MDLALFLLSALLFLILAVLSARLLRVQSPPYLLVFLLLIPSAGIVLLTQTLNLFGLLGSKIAFLSGQFLLLIPVFAANRRLATRFEPRQFFQSTQAFIQTLRRDLVLLLWAGGLSIAWLFNLLLTFVVPPNNNDALSTHIARVAFWLRNGSLAAWETDRWYQLIYPPNAQLVLYWQALFLRTDLLFGALQWLAGLLSGVAVYALARRLGFSIRAGTAAAFTFLSFPVVIFQSSTTQNDLVMAFFVISSVLFMLRAVQTNSLADLAIAWLAGSLGFGVKQTFFFFLPLLLGLSIWSFIRLRPRLKPVGWGLFVLGTLLFAFISGGNKYLENTLSFGNPMGPQTVLAIQTNQQPLTQLPAKLLTNSLRAMYGAIDPSGLPQPLFGYFHKIRSAVFTALPIRPMMESANYLAPDKVFLVDTVYPANEDTAQYGPAGLIILALAMAGAFRTARRGDMPAIILLVGGLTAYLMLVLLRPGWDEFQARYMIPILGLLLPYWGKSLTESRWPWRTTILILGLLSLYSVSLYNPAKPVLGKDALNLNIWQADRVSLMMAQNRSLAGSVRLVERHVPAEAPLGVYGANDYHFQYPFFGEGYTRDVVPIIDERRLADEAWLSERGLDYLLLRVKDGQDFIRPPASYLKLDAMEGWRLYQRQP